MTGLDELDPALIEATAKTYLAAWKADIKRFVACDVPSWDEMGEPLRAAMRPGARRAR